MEHATEKAGCIQLGEHPWFSIFETRLCNRGTGSSRGNSRKEGETGLYPTGFRDKDVEAKFLQFYWETFPVNQRWLMGPLAFAIAVYFGVQICKHVIAEECQWSTVGSHAVGFMWHVTQAYFMSLQHMPSTFKRLFSFSYRCAMVVMPCCLVFEACATDPISGIIALVSLSTLGSWTCPYLIHHALNLAGVGFIPIFYSAVLGGGRRRYLMLLFCLAVILFIVGTAFCSAVCVHRRQEWLHRRKPRSARRSSRLGHRRSSSSSFSCPTSSGDRSRSRSRSRSREASPLPRVDETKQEALLSISRLEPRPE